MAGSSSVILTALREQTRHLHERAERAFDLPARLRSLDTYAALLGRLYGFYAPLERRLAAVEGYETVGFTLADRLKTPLLRRDLHALHFSPEAIAALPMCESLPNPRELGSAFGCLYVLEGATLGGNLIRGEVGRAFGFGPESGCAFFSSYGTRIGGMWKDFCRAVSEFASRNPDAHDQVVTAAVETFTRFEEWVAW